MKQGLISKNRNNPLMEEKHSSEQIEAVNRIKRCKDYYEILNVNEDASDKELKKAYHKLALQLHPDKNTVPGASDAFKVVSNAFSTLYDRNKRKDYGLYRKENLWSSRISSEHLRQEFTSNVTAEELFNMFFGADLYGQNIFMRNGRRVRVPRGEAQRREHHHQPNNGNLYPFFVQIFPVLVLLMFSMMSGFLIAEPVYSIHQSQNFPVARKTTNLQVPYYVKHNFQADYKGSLKRLEISIEEEYLNGLRSTCHRENHYKISMLRKARYFGNKNEIHKAQNLTTPSCDILNKIFIGG